MEEVRYRRRKPAVERKIGEIREDDTRVALIGKAFKVDKMDYTFWLDDGTGVILIESEENVLPQNGQTVRVVGRVIRNEEGIHIYGEVIQDFSEADLEALEEIRELERKVLPRVESVIEFFGGEEL
ncbi:replication factor A complex, RPA14 subunit [Thermococcus onnurineus NA1]|uniref:Replication factor A complex, RPA14 subunit n=1 Tax=Thermococcus onnurineus (strain NA1) TaxID=523850 RepID=B6YW79_THEON|nr:MULTISPECIES: replication factor A complex, RPA14 subunit [Thermococcus]ACJ17445.1 replication factor A complex, RPA14 subunit [Thermococcus onnurineus NA1]NJE45819.1 replication protein RepA [Thermococcus sp. GR7]NJE79219.1 replication protein RepA [Thermococcus sp. GR4]NJF22013.1 replication protein RepA [Thermococcus sp. GR5]